MFTCPKGPAPGRGIRFRLLPLLAALAVTVGQQAPRHLSASELPRYTWHEVYFDQPYAYADGMNQAGDVVGNARKWKLVEVWYPEDGFWVEEVQFRTVGLFYAAQEDVVCDVNDWFEEVPREQWPQVTRSDGSVSRSAVVKGMDAGKAFRISSLTGLNDSREMIGQARLYEFDDTLGFYVYLNVIVPIRITHSDTGPELHNLSALFPEDQWPGVYRVEAKAINDVGDIAGEYYDEGRGDNPRRGFFYDALNNTVRDIGDLGKGETTDVIVYSLNSWGQIAGKTTIEVRGKRNERAFRWSPDSQGDTMLDLGVLWSGTDHRASGRSINDHGHVAGWSRLNPSDFHAFIYTDDRGLVDLGTLGGINSAAHGINNHGAIVGWSGISGGGARMFLYTQAAGMADLEARIDDWPAEYIGKMYLDSMRINDAGVVVVNNMQTKYIVILRPIDGSTPGNGGEPGEPDLGPFVSADTPLTIADPHPRQGTRDTVSTITIAGTGASVDSLLVWLDISHGEPVQLSGELVNPAGVTVKTFAQGELGGVQEWSVLLGSSQPLDGAWKLILRDHVRGVTGTLNEWAMMGQAAQ
jgi:probable HAF family extracellular repeat protein